MATVPAGVKVMRRIGAGREFVFVLNFTDAEALAKLSSGGYADALTGEPVAQQLQIASRDVRILRRLP